MTEEQIAEAIAHHRNILLEEVEKRLTVISNDLRTHIAWEEEALKSAFPEADLAAHRIIHEQMIEASREEAKFWRELRQDLVKKGIIGLITIALGLIVVGLSFKIGLTK